MQAFRHIERYHFRSQSRRGRPRKKIRPGIRPVPGFLFQFTPGGLQRAFLPFIPGNTRRQPYGPGMQGNTVFFHQKQFSFFRHGHDHNSSAGIHPAHVFPPSLFQEFQKFPPAERQACFLWLFHLFHDAAHVRFPSVCCQPCGTPPFCIFPCSSNPVPVSG